jgi:hypothetical protein
VRIVLLLTRVCQAKRRYKKSKGGSGASSSGGSAHASFENSPQTTPVKTKRATSSPVPMKDGASSREKKERDDNNGRSSASTPPSPPHPPHPPANSGHGVRVRKVSKELSEEELESRKCLEMAVREETLWRDLSHENEPGRKVAKSPKGKDQKLRLDASRAKELKRAKRQIEELKFRAQDAIRRAEVQWKLKEARTASDSFCALFPDKEKVLSSPNC